MNSALLEIKARLRIVIQMISAIFINGYLVGFYKGEIYDGTSKVICLPILNCYSCPGSLGSCPIGAMQAVAGDNRYRISFYVVGTIMLIGTLFGRLVCGFICPFGLFQDLLYKVKVKKFYVPRIVDKKLRYMKYILLIMVLILPVLLANKYGVGAPYFCKLICPVGTLEGGLPLLWKNSSLRNSLGILFVWKLGLLLCIIILSIIIYRPFCKYLCPLGALYAPFNRYSFFQMNVDKDRCTNCQICEDRCKMNVDIRKNINGAECIRCGECRSVCPQEAIACTFNKRRSSNYE